MSDSPGTLYRTCLYQQHLAGGGRMVPFAGWEMPVQYGGILEEHQAVREAAGMFDVSHMGRIEFSGAGCIPFLQRIFTCDVAAIEPGQARYTLICVEDGGILDDTILYCRRPDSFLLVCNASNRGSVLDWLDRWKQPHEKVAWADHTAETSMIALQGPRAAGVLASITGPDLPRDMRYFHWADASVAGADGAIARTGYTGEDGFEIMLPAEAAPGLWQRLLELQVKPCGLGARDTLRLEAALPLHGNDISLQTNPVEAGLQWTLAMEKTEPFLGREAIQRVQQQGPDRRLVGFELAGRGIPRPHCGLLSLGARIGEATSGGYAPTLKKGIGMGYVPSALAKVGTGLDVDIRGTLAPATVVRRPFYRRPGARPG